VASGLRSAAAHLTTKAKSPPKSFIKSTEFRGWSD
jgi:hypothetical protein